jgi:ankyrin repeat protein
MKKETKTKNIPEYIINTVYGNDFDTVKEWIAKNSKDTIDKDKRTLLIHSVIAKNYILTEWLLKYGCDPNIIDQLGWSPLHYAAQNYSVLIGKLLIQYGANLEIKDKYGNTPLWRAVFSSQGNGDFITLLIEYGADINNVNNSGISPVKLANTIANYNIKQFFNN